MKHIFYIAIILISTLSLAQNKTLFDQGNSLYNEGKFQEAITTYERILEVVNGF